MNDQDKRKNLLLAINALRDNPHFVLLREEIKQHYEVAKAATLEPPRKTDGDVATGVHLHNTGVMLAYENLLDLIDRPEDIISVE